VLADELAIEAWAAAIPQDVLDERAFYAQKKVELRAEKDGIRACKRFMIRIILLRYLHDEFEEEDAEFQFCMLHQ
jgi:hypothetical protein